MKKKNWKRSLALLFGGFIGIALQASSFAQIKSWGVISDVSQRFQVLASFNSQAVLDRVTGLIWEKSPAALSVAGISASFLCSGKMIDNKMGWRLPKIEELTSLIVVNPLNQNLTLPAGHPFHNVTTGNNDCFWSSSVSAGDPNKLLCMPVDGPGLAVVDKGTSHPFWCVRGNAN